MIYLIAYAGDFHVVLNINKLIWCMCYLDGSEAKDPLYFDLESETNVDNYVKSSSQGR